MTCKEQLERGVQSLAKTIEEVARDFEAINEYFEDVLDVEIRCDLQGRYRGARVALGLGGPSFYLDTCRGSVEGIWGGDRAEWFVRRFATDAANEYFKELWEMSRGY